MIIQLSPIEITRALHSLLVVIGLFLASAQIELLSNCNIPECCRLRLWVDLAWHVRSSVALVRSVGKLRLETPYCKSHWKEWVWTARKIKWNASLESFKCALHVYEKQFSVVFTGTGLFLKSLTDVQYFYGHSSLSPFPFHFLFSLVASTNVTHVTAPTNITTKSWQTSEPWQMSQLWKKIVRGAFMILLYQQKNYNGESLMKQKSKKIYNDPLYEFFWWGTKSYKGPPYMIFSGESNDYIKVPLMSFC